MCPSCNGNLTACCPFDLAIVFYFLITVWGSSALVHSLGPVLKPFLDSKQRYVCCQPDPFLPSSFPPPPLPFSLFPSLHIAISPSFSFCLSLSCFLCHLVSFTLSGNLLLLCIPEVANDTEVELGGEWDWEHDHEWAEDECVRSRWASGHTKTRVFPSHTRSYRRIQSLFGIGPFSLFSLGVIEFTIYFKYIHTYQYIMHLRCMYVYCICNMVFGNALAYVECILWLENKLVQFSWRIPFERAGDILNVSLTCW